MSWNTSVSDISTVSKWFEEMTTETNLTNLTHGVTTAPSTHTTRVMSLSTVLDTPVETTVLVDLTHPTSRPISVDTDTLIHDQDLSPLGLLTIIILTFIGNILVCLAVKVDKRLHFMTYYFFISMSVLHIIMACVVMPMAILVILHGYFPYSEEMCKLWITLDLFFCNNTSLHLAFTNMDTFLRLKDPLRHGRVTTTCSVVLWIGASWIISCVQAIAQFMLSQGDHGIIHTGICFITDKNFVILGTMFSFLIPTVISVVFYTLCVYEIKALKGGKMFEESEASQNAYHYGSTESIIPEEDMTDTASCASDTIETIPREQVQLAVVADMKDGTVKEYMNGGAPNRDNVEEMTSFCDTANGECEGGGITNLSFADHIVSTDQSTSCTLLLRDPNNHHAERINYIRPSNELDYSSPDENLRMEQAISRLMFMMMVLYIALWIPFSASNVVYGVCIHCRSHMSFDEVNTFKWLAYSTSFLGPILYGKFCEPVRDAYWRIITCKCLFKH